MNKDTRNSTLPLAITRSFRKVAAAEQTLHFALLSECRRLTAVMDYDEKERLYFWPHAEGLAREGFECKCGICTNGARLVAKQFGGFVAGYCFDEKDPEPLVGRIAGGHDFAVVGPFIVDWWAWEHEHSIECPVILRAEGIRLAKYKSEAAWGIYSANDFRVPAS